MTEPISDERLAELQADITAGIPIYPTSARDLFDEVDRLRATLTDIDWSLAQTEIARRDERDRADRAEAALARVTDESMGERMLKPIHDAMFGNDCTCDYRNDLETNAAAAAALTLIRAVADEPQSALARTLVRLGIPADKANTDVAEWERERSDDGHHEWDTDDGRGPFADGDDTGDGAMNLLDAINALRNHDHDQCGTPASHTPTPKETNQ